MPPYATRDRSPGRERARWAPRWTGDARHFVDELIGWLLSVGRAPGACGLSLLDHSLQTAERARLAGARPELVLAALLHDIGEPLGPLLEAEHETLAAHERLGASWLARYFPAGVTEPIRLHVDAGRWLAASEPGHVAALDPAARAALDVAGGALEDGARDSFEAEPHAGEALSLYRWDAAAHVIGHRPPPLDVYRATLVGHVRTRR